MKTQQGDAICFVEFKLSHGFNSPALISPKAHVKDENTLSLNECEKPVKSITANHDNHCVCRMYFTDAQQILVNSFDPARHTANYTTVTFRIADNEQLIGFYGNLSQGHLSNLGFIVKVWNSS